MIARPAVANAIGSQNLKRGGSLEILAGSVSSQEIRLSLWCSPAPNVIMNDVRLRGLALPTLPVARAPTTTPKPLGT